jgi:methylated-DNA-[protein]-cysteine S-methyltransferase
VKGVGLFYKEMASPVGKLTLVANTSALVAVRLEREQPTRLRLDPASPDAHHPVLVEAERQLADYFAGKRTSFELPIEPSGTEFQKQVWRCLRQIPFGRTRSYGEIARTVGSPQGSRAVGAACGKNPLAIVVPCHRVLGANGALTGFGGGIDAKAKLLALEALASGVPRRPEMNPDSAVDTTARRERGTNLE